MRERLDEKRLPRRNVKPRNLDESSTSKELVAKIRYAAALEHLTKPTQSELVAQLGISAESLAAWKRRRDWSEAVEAISTEMLFTSPLVKHFIQQMLEDGSPVMRERAARTLVRLAFPGS